MIARVCGTMKNDVKEINVKKRASCPRCGGNSNNEFCEVHQKDFERMVGTLRLAYIHQMGHPNKHTLWVNVEDSVRSAPNVAWIKDGKCINKGESICNLGWACDGCPWNFDKGAKAKAYAFPGSVVDLKRLRQERTCCACKKHKKIVNVGGPPLCKDCYPLACNWSRTLQSHEKFMRSLAGITPLEISIGRDDDLSYWLEQVTEDLADAKMKIKQTEICLINVATMLRNEAGGKKDGSLSK